MAVLAVAGIFWKGSVSLTGGVTVSEAADEFPFSNFAPAEIVHDGITYPTIENYYQAMKTLDIDVRVSIARMTPGQAKRFGRQISVRPDWDSIKEQAMWQGLVRKFAPGSSWAARLLESGERELVEWNTWHDRYWGRCTCPRCGGEGANRLGMLLTRLRAQLRDASTTPR